MVLPSFCDGASICQLFFSLCSMQDLGSLTRDQTCAPVQWKRRVLTTGPPGKSLLSAFRLHFAVVVYSKITILASHFVFVSM